MKKTTLIALLLIGLLALTACGGPATFAKADTSRYLTLGDYKGLSFKLIDTSVSDYDLSVAVNKKLSDSGYVTHAENVPITNGTVQLGDTINLDYKGTKDGVAFQGGTASNQSLTIGSGQFIPGFEEGLAGKRIGSDVKLNLTFPEDYGNEELAGQKVVFEVKINSVTDRVTYSELTDALANTLDSTVKTAKEFTEKIKKDETDKREADAITKTKEILWNAAVSNVSFKNKLPQKLLKQAKDEFTAYYTAIAKQNNFNTLEEFLSKNNITKDTFNDRTTQYAESIVKSQLAAYAIAKAEGYTVSEEALNATAEKNAPGSGYSDAQKYIDAVGKDAVEDQAILDFAVDLVFDNGVATK